MSPIQNRILIADGLNTEIIQELKKLTHIKLHDKSKYGRDEIIALGNSIDILIVRSATKVDEELIKQLPHLKMVIRAGEGMDNIDKNYCEKKNITALNTPGANGNAAAELAIALMFNLARKINPADLSMKQGKWDKSKFVGCEITNKKIGIIGFGKIGQTIAKRLSGFNPEISYFDPTRNDSAPNIKKVETLDEIFQKCDFITLHLPFMESTKNLITKKYFEQMKPSAYLINCARGGIVNESDLLWALENKKFAGAALDVFDQEPLPENSPLRKCEQLVLTPHLGASSLEAEIRVGLMVLEIIKNS